MFGTIPDRGLSMAQLPKTGLSAMFTGHSVNGSAYQAINNGCICATGMNMLYIGIPNNINVAIPGVASSRTSATISSGTIQKDGDHYTVSVSRPGKVTITATGGGKQFSMEFRVRQIPMPVAQWGTIQNDGLPKPRLVCSTQTRILATMGESFALYTVKYVVVRYTLIYQPVRGEARIFRVEGNRIPGSAIGLIQKGSRGDRIIVDQIRASGPGGDRPLSPIILGLR